MHPSTLFAILACAFALWGGISGGRIGAELQRRGHRVHWILMKVLVIRWVHVYRQLTVAETGKPGPLYRQFIIGMNGALVFAILALLLR